MADQDTWLESKIGTEIRIYLAVTTEGKMYSHVGRLEYVEAAGIVLEDRWFNRSQIAYVEVYTRDERTTIPVTQHRRGS